MTRKERVAKRKELFSAKAYLYKKAQIRAVKLQSRAARRNGTLSQQPEHVHTHEHNHDHEHEEEALVIHEDDLTKIE